MNLFYTPNISDTKNYVLSETESKHAIKVLRLNEGDIIHLVNGKGVFYKAEISLAHPKKCQVRIIKQKIEPVLKPKIHIAIAPTKNNDRLEWFIEKATEIGVSEITPVICENSERYKLKTERLTKKAISAIKQSLKATLPLINETIKFNNFISKEFNGGKYIAHCYKQQQAALKNCYTKGKNALILIGPEGDFSEQEIHLAFKNGFTPVTFGKSRLRTETAGVVACHTINMINE